MKTYYSHILSTTLFITISSSLCSEKSIQTHFAPLPIKAESIVCPTDNYAVIQTDSTTCRIYDLIQQKIIREIKDEGPIYNLAKHPHNPLIAVSRHTDINKCIDTISVYTVPEGEKISHISKDCFLSAPIFNLNDTIISTDNSSQSFFTLNYKTNKIREFTRPYKVNLNQWFKMPYDANFINKIFKTSPQSNIKSSDDIHNNDKSCITLNKHDQNNKYTQHLLSLLMMVDYGTYQKTISIKHAIQQNPILSSAFHPTKPHLIALLAAKQSGIKQSNYDHILVHLFNIKNKKLTTLLDKKFSDLKSSLNDAPANANLIDFFNNGTQLIVSLINKCITIDVPKLNENA